MRALATWLERSQRGLSARNLLRNLLALAGLARSESSRAEICHGSARVGARNTALCRRRREAKPEQSTRESPVVSCGTTPCQAGGSGWTPKHRRWPKSTLGTPRDIRSPAITRGDATRNVAVRPTSSSRASLRAALVLERSLWRDSHQREPPHPRPQIANNAPVP